MKHDLLWNRFIAAGGVGLSEPFPLNGDTAVVVQLASIFGTLTNATLQSSDDMENWHAGGDAVTVPGSAPEVAFTTVVGFGAPYGRLKLTANTDSIVNACLNTAAL